MEEERLSRVGEDPAFAGMLHEESGTNEHQLVPIGLLLSQAAALLLPAADVCHRNQVSTIE
jgi:hypothetical protein